MPNATYNSMILIAKTTIRIKWENNVVFSWVPSWNLCYLFECREKSGFSALGGGQSSITSVSPFCMSSGHESFRLKVTSGLYHLEL